MSLPYLPEAEMSLLSSITSTDLEKIVLPLRYEYGTTDFSPYGRYPRMLDDCLCQLVQRLRRLGYQHKLELEFHIPDVPDDQEVFKVFLPQFRQLGRVKLISEEDGRVVYSSDQ